MNWEKPDGIGGELADLRQQVADLWIWQRVLLGMISTVIGVLIGLALAHA